MFDGDPGVFFGPLTGADVGNMPAEVLPERLGWGLERYADVGPYAELRLASAANLRAQGDAPDADAFGRELLMLEPLIDGALKFDTPSPAGMGLLSWDKVVPDVPEAGAGVEKKARRMARRLFTEDDEDDLPRKRPDAPAPEALRRAADLTEAIARLRALEAAAEDKARHTQLVNLRVDLQRRLVRERRHDAALDALLPPTTQISAETVATLRAHLAQAGRGPEQETLAPEAGPATRVTLERQPASRDNPYLSALEEATARLDAPLARDAAPPADPERLATVRRAAATAVSIAVSGGRGAERAAARARKLFAEEVALTGGRPGADATPEVDTLTLRRQLAQRFPGTPPIATVSPDALVPATGLPEVPLLSSRGPAARVVGVAPAGVPVQVVGPPQGGFHPVVVGGRRAWVPEAFLRRAGERPAAWPQPLTPPDRLAPLPPSPGAGARAARMPAPVGGPVDVRNVLVEGPTDATGGDTARVVSAALGALPDVLGSRMRGRPARRAEQSELTLVLDLPAGTRDPQIRGRILADQMADALVRMGASTLDTLKLQIRVRETRTEPTPDRLLDAVGAGDTEGLATQLASERRTLDAATRNRLASFFGHDFSDVMVFAGPMSGAMARSLSAEAFTHGKMVFFDPKHFRTDTPRGEALLAHELTHTRQADSDRDVKAKEAEALAAEARFLDWVAPGGAPLAKELDELAATSPSAQAAADATPSRRGVHRAEEGRQLEASEGPRAETAKFDERVKNVLQRVQEMMSDRGDFEADRVGRLIRSGVLHL